MDNILILGAGIYQVPLIKRAKQLGYRVLVCTIPGNYPGIALADEVFFADTTNSEECLQIAKRNHIAAVCTAGTDVALPTLGRIVDTLHLHGPCEESALYSSNKFLMKEAFSKGNVLSAAYRRVHNYDECVEAACSIGFPCVLKVVDSSGSRGIEVVKKEDELPSAYQYVLQYTKQKYILVEEFLAGEEFGAQAFVYEGKVVFVMAHSDEVFHGATGVPVGHSVPLDASLRIDEESIAEEAKKAIKALHIDNSAVNIDFILVDGKPYVLEVGARCGATGLAELVAINYGIDYYEMIIRAALGSLDLESIANLHQRQAATVLLITSDASGTMKSYNQCVSHPQLVSYSLDYTVGEHVNKFKIGPDRIGQVIAIGGSAEESLKFAQEIIQQINIKIEPNMKPKVKKSWGGVKSLELYHLPVAA